MPERETVERARRAKRQGKAASTQAGEFVHEEIEHIRDGRHGVKSTKQAIAIGLSKARRAGIKVPAKTSSGAPKKAEGKNTDGASPKRSRAAAKTLEKSGAGAVSTSALSSHAKSAASKRSASSRSTAAKKAAITKGAAGRSAAAKKAARTRTHAIAH